MRRACDRCSRLDSRLARCGRWRFAYRFPGSGVVKSGLTAWFNSQVSTCEPGPLGYIWWSSVRRRRRNMCLWLVSPRPVAPEIETYEVVCPLCAYRTVPRVPSFPTKIVDTFHAGRPSTQHLASLPRIPRNIGSGLGGQSGRAHRGPSSAIMGVHISDRTKLITIIVLVTLFLLAELTSKSETPQMHVPLAFQAANPIPTLLLPQTHIPPCANFLNRIVALKTGSLALLADAFHYVSVWSNPDSA